MPTKVIIQIQPTVWGGYIAKWKGSHLPFDATLAIGRGLSTDEAAKDLISQTSKEILNSLSPFETIKINQVYGA